MMRTKETKHAIIDRLKQNLLQWQGMSSDPGMHTPRSLGLLDQIFPGKVFPSRAVHEFICGSREEGAASTGFISAVLSKLLDSEGVCLWIGTHRAIFPPAIQAFQVDPSRFLFVEMPRSRDVFWAIEEALKCQRLGAIIAEVSALDFVQSRRLQLGVERSGVSTFLLRHVSEQQLQHLGITASSVRWRIRSFPSQSLEGGMPGVGFTRWSIQTLKVRNGNPGHWVVEWKRGEFANLAPWSASGADLREASPSPSPSVLPTRLERRASG